jgi:hypothetical protein
MSVKVRNPFLLRTSERIESDVSFLRLYSHFVLESLIEKDSEDKLFDTILFIRSSPGAGKTSLLRLFEPNSLVTLHNRKSGDEFKELYKNLKKLDAITDEGVELLGISLAFTRNYEMLEDLVNIEETKRNRLFFSLLNSRIITSTLRSILQLKKLRFPEDLAKISFNYDNKDIYIKKVIVPCDGKVLYEWASGIEVSIYNFLDSFLPNTYEAIEGHDELFAVKILKPDFFLVEGKPVCKRFLIMLDDLHKLSSNQRNMLIQYLIEKRSNSSIWLSERLESLSNLGTSEGRDYNILNIEDYWKDREGRFEKLLLNIASKRADDSRQEISFSLDQNINEDELKDVIKRAKSETLNSVKALTTGTTKYDNWKKYIELSEGTDLQVALLAKKVEILINRDVSKRQLEFNFALPVEEIEERGDEKVNSAAKLFLFKKYNLPFYYSFPSVAKISTNNIEQFLSFGAPLYERMLSLNLNMDNVIISAKVQDKEIKKIANDKWNELPKIVPDGFAVARFVENMCRFFYSETFKPTASYAPGVNGFNVDVTKIIDLIKEPEWLSSSMYAELQVVLNNCLAFNLLHVRETTQGKKGEKKNVYYLNRWICVKFDLPLSYGGWRSKKPDDLLRWLKK